MINIVIVVVNDNLMILIIGFTCPPTIHFKFITKCNSLFCYKVRQNKVTDEIVILRPSQYVIETLPPNFGAMRYVDDDDGLLFVTASITFKKKILGKGNLKEFVKNVIGPGKVTLTTKVPLTEDIRTDK